MIRMAGSMENHLVFETGFLGYLNLAIVQVHLVGFGSSVHSYYGCFDQACFDFQMNSESAEDSGLG